MPDLPTADALSDVDTTWLDEGRRALQAERFDPDPTGRANGETPLPDAPNLEPAAVAGVLRMIEEIVSRYVHLRREAEVIACVLWVAHTYCFDRFEQSPILTVSSAVMRSGKTRLFDVLELVVCRPWRVILPSDAVVYRYIEHRRPSMLLDEADAIFNKRASDYEGLRALLNAGNRRGTVVPRVVGQGSKMRIQEFAVFCPKAIAGIGSFPATIADRGIPIRMERRSSREPVAKFRHGFAESEARPIREALESLHLGDALERARPSVVELPPELDDRAAESWEPLQVVAEVAGHDWPARARRAAVTLHAARDQDEEALSLVLLRDVRTIFEDRQDSRIHTTDLLSALHEMEESPWGEYLGKPITGHAIAKLLRPYSIEPRLLRLGDKVKRGYSVDQFEDAFARYVPSTATPAETATSVTGQQEEAGFVEDVALVTLSESVAVEGQTNGDGMLRAALQVFPTDEIPP